VDYEFNKLIQQIKSFFPLWDYKQYRGYCMKLTSFLSDKELKTRGFKSIGKNVKISKYARFYDTASISIGNNVRIDDFCILSGAINLGSNIHISAYSALYGQYGIEMQDFSGVSPRCTILSASDDFSGEYMVGPMVPEDIRGVNKGKVMIEKYVQVGAGSIIMPGVILAEGSAIGAMSLVKGNADSWSIYAGVPARFLKKRMKTIKKRRIRFCITQNHDKGRNEKEIGSE